MRKTGNGAFSWWAPEAQVQAAPHAQSGPADVAQQAAKSGVVLQRDGSYRAPNGTTVVPKPTAQGMFFKDEANGIVYDPHGYLIMKNADGRVVAAPPSWPAPAPKELAIARPSGDPVATAADVSQVPKTQIPTWVLPAAAGAGVTALGVGAYVLFKGKKRR